MKFRALVFIAVTWCLAQSPVARAHSLESAYARLLIRARSTARADLLKTRFERARVAQLTCRLQLDRGLAPIACYEVLITERDWALRTPAEISLTRRGLDHRCARAAAGLRVPAGEESLRHVGPACAARIRDARAIEAYRREDPAWSGD